MITKKQAEHLTYRQIVYDTVAKNADGTPARWYVSGKPKLWKRDPKRFRVPVKHGLYENWEIVPSNAHRFRLKELMK